MLPWTTPSLLKKKVVHFELTNYKSLIPVWANDKHTRVSFPKRHKSRHSDHPVYLIHERYNGITSKTGFLQVAPKNIKLNNKTKLCTLHALMCKLVCISNERSDCFNSRLETTGCSLDIVFFLKMLWFFWTLSVLLQALGFDLPLCTVCTHTDAEGKPREARGRNISSNHRKNTIFNEHPVFLELSRLF